MRKCRMRVNEGRAVRNEEPIRFPPCMLERNIEIDYRLILKVLIGTAGDVGPLAAKAVDFQNTVSPGILKRRLTF